MALYFLQKGKHYGPDKDGVKRIIRPGELAELNPSQALAFADRFKSPDVAEAEARVLQIQLEAARKIQAARTEVAAMTPQGAPVLDAEAAKSGGKAARENTITNEAQTVPAPANNADPLDPEAVSAVPNPGTGPTFEVPSYNADGSPIGDKTVGKSGTVGTTVAPAPAPAPAPKAAAPVQAPAPVQKPAQAPVKP
jgi:hypothetical protein